MLCALGDGFGVIVVCSVFFGSQDVVNDVDGAQKVGMRGILVKTGIYSNIAICSVESVVYRSQRYLLCCVYIIALFTQNYYAGKYREGDEIRIQPAPWRVCETFSHAVDLILESSQLD